MYHLDELDLVLIRELEQNARVSQRSLASKLGISQPTARRRLSRLIDQGIISIITVPDYGALGYNARLIFTIKVPPGMLNEVVEQISAIGSVQLLCSTMGRYDLVGWALYHNTETFIRSFPEEMATVSEALTVETILIAELIKNNPGYLSQHDGNVVSGLHTEPTKLDLSIITELQKDPRISIKVLSEKAGVSAKIIRASLSKLISEGIVRISCIPNPAAFGRIVTGITLMKVAPSSLNTVTNTLKGYPSVRVLALTIGAFNCVIFTSFSDPDQMSNFLAQELGYIRGVVQYESLLVLDTHKTPFSLPLI